MERKGLVEKIAPRTYRWLEPPVKPHVFQHVTPGSTMYTDSLRSYVELSESYRHFIINHGERYVDGQVHMNNIEDF